MNIIKLEVEFEKIFPLEYFDLKKYKNALELGLIEKLSNKDFENEDILKSHLKHFHSMMGDITNFNN